MVAKALDDVVAEVRSNACLRLRACAAAASRRNDGFWVDAPSRRSRGWARKGSGAPGYYWPEA